MPNERKDRHPDAHKGRCSAVAPRTCWNEQLFKFTTSRKVTCAGELNNTAPTLNYLPLEYNFGGLKLYPTKVCELWIQRRTYLSFLCFEQGSIRSLAARSLGNNFDRLKLFLTAPYASRVSTTICLNSPRSGGRKCTHRCAE